MLLDGHDLDAVVAVGNDAGQHILRELTVGTHLLSVLRHTHVAFVDEQGRLGGFEFLLAEGIGHLGVPHLGREDFRHVILHHTLTPGGNPFALATVPLHLHLVKVAVLDGFLSEFQFPVAGTLNALQFELRVFLPVVEITDEIDFRGVWSPLSEHPSLGLFVQAVIEVSAGKVAQGLLAFFGEHADFPCGMFMTSADSLFEGFQPGVILHEPDMFGCFGFGRSFPSNRLFGGGCVFLFNHINESL